MKGGQRQGRETEGIRQRTPASWPILPPLSTGGEGGLGVFAGQCPGLSSSPLRCSWGYRQHTQLHVYALFPVRERGRPGSSPGACEAPPCPPCGGSEARTCKHRAGTPFPLPGSWRGGKGGGADGGYQLGPALYPAEGGRGAGLFFISCCGQSSAARFERPPKSAVCGQQPVRLATVSSFRGDMPAESCDHSSTGGGISARLMSPRRIATDHPSCYPAP